LKTPTTVRLLIESVVAISGSLDYDRPIISALVGGLREAGKLAAGHASNGMERKGTSDDSLRRADVTATIKIGQRWTMFTSSTY